MIVLDTNVVSELMARGEGSSAVRWLNAQQSDTLYITSITIAEIRFGIDILGHGARRTGLAGAFGEARDLFRDRVMPFDDESAERFAALAARRRSGGRPLPIPDGYIAAIAASRGFAVATRNVRDFAGTGVEVIDPWA